MNIATIKIFIPLLTLPSVTKFKGTSTLGFKRKEVLFFQCALFVVPSEVKSNQLKHGFFKMYAQTNK